MGTMLYCEVTFYHVLQPVRYLLYVKWEPGSLMKYSTCYLYCILQGCV